MIGLLIKSTILWDLFSLFPAYAGVILTEEERCLERMTFPRIRGGDPEMLLTAICSMDFSPHTRG